MHHIDFGIKQTKMHSHMFVDVPLPVYNALTADRQTDTPLNDSLLTSRAVSAMEVEDGRRLHINTNRIGTMKSDQQDRALSRVARLIHELGSLQPPEVSDPMLEVSLGMEADGLPMYAKVVLAEDQSDTALSIHATNHMQDTARVLRLADKNTLRQTVGARVSKLHGISLMAHTIGGSSLETERGSYDPTADAVELYGHNFYNHAMQLVCLAGVVALKRGVDLRPE